MHYCALYLDDNVVYVSLDQLDVDIPLCQVLPQCRQVPLGAFVVF
jgi:hypothetical protein